MLFFGYIVKINENFNLNIRYILTITGVRGIEIFITENDYIKGRIKYVKKVFTCSNQLNVNYCMYLYCLRP